MRNVRLRGVPVAGVLSTGDDTWYTVPGSTHARVDGFWTHNAHTAAVVVRVWINTGGAESVYVVNVTLDASHTLYPQTPILLGPGYEIHAQAGVANVVQFYLSIEERTE